MSSFRTPPFYSGSENKAPEARVGVDGARLQAPRAVRARAELAALVTTPENLRVRRWKPSKADVDRVQAWIWKHNRPFDETKTRVTATGPHPTSGLLMIGFRLGPARSPEL